MTTGSDDRASQVYAVISDALGLKAADLGPNPAMYRTAGWDSLVMFDIISGLEEHFGIVIEADDVQQCTSYRGIRDMLAARLPEQ